MRGIVLASLLFTALLTSGTAWLFAAPADTEDLTIPVDPGVTSHPEPPGGDMRIWEANWKGLATIHQVAVEAPPGSGSLKPIVYRVENAHDRAVVLDEYVLLLTPHPLFGALGGEVTQDGVLDLGSVPASFQKDYYYGESVLGGPFTGEAVWFCVEPSGPLNADVEVRLGGEILPFAMETYFQYGPTDGSQEAIWNHIGTEATMVIGKTPLVQGLTGLKNETVRITLYGTNLSPASTNTGTLTTVIDTVPAGWEWRNPTEPPTSVTPNPDGSTELRWEVDLSAIDITAPNSFGPGFRSVRIAYDLVTPAGLHGGRLYLPRAQLDVTGDGAVDAHSAEPLLEITKDNHAPTVRATGVVAPEGTSVTLTAMGADEDGDPLLYRWDLDGDGLWDTPYAPEPSVEAPWGDDHFTEVTVAVTDGEDFAAAMAVLHAQNVAPGLEVAADLTATAHLTLRVAGEKFHDVTAIVLRNGTAVSGGSLVRMPGSPDDQLLDLGVGVAEDVVEIVYTPLDDPVNGRVWGATPAWLILEQGGMEKRLHHTFNARHADTWVWSVDLSPSLRPSGVELTATASDPGSDDLTVTIDWGDGTVETQVFPNDASAGPDPDPSPEVNPRSITITALHAYAAAGTYTITVTVQDDDGGSTAVTVLVAV